MKHQSV